jgi:hypothetical protein
MVESGARPNSFEKFTNCPKVDRSPNITFKLGNGPDAVSISLSEKDNIRRSGSDCELILLDSTISNSHILGMDILSRLMTVFDQRNDRVGFCHIALDRAYYIPIPDQHTTTNL